MLGKRIMQENKERQTVSVSVRLRPLFENEQKKKEAYIWKHEEGSNTLNLAPEVAASVGRRVTMEYSFDHLYWGSDNYEVYLKSVQPLITSAMEGYNVTVFAYGQTASGKTYTMTGTDLQVGIIPRSIKDVFAYIQNAHDDGQREYLLRVSYLEIYNETIRDLLCSKLEQPSEPRILFDKKRGVYVSPLKEEIVTSPAEVMQILRTGEANRHKSDTEYNEHSSRSHTIFQMVIESRPRQTQELTEESVTISTLSLIDLAGSERASSSSERRMEGAFINKSLLTLGTVISKLSEKEKNRKHIPYRDSKLTRILQPSLDGNAKVAVICAISPGLSNFDESASTLKFASRVKKVVTSYHLTKVVDEKALLQKYRQEIDQLKQQLAETTKLINRDRDQEISLLKKEKIKFEENIHEHHVVRTALKERIDHLTRLILTSSSIPSRRISSVIQDLQSNSDLQPLGIPDQTSVSSTPSSSEDFKDKYISSLESILNRNRAQQSSMVQESHQLEVELKGKDRLISDLQKSNSSLMLALKAKDEELQKLRERLCLKESNTKITSNPDETTFDSNMILKLAKQQQRIVVLEKMVTQKENKMPSPPPSRSSERPSNHHLSSSSLLADDASVATRTSTLAVNAIHSKVKELESQLEKEKKLRSEEQLKYSQTIAGLEAELTICQAELTLSDMFSQTLSISVKE